MAFPTVPTGGRVVTSTNTVGGATKTFPSLTGLTKNVGDLLIAIAITYDGNSTNAEFSGWGGGFTEFGDFATTTTMGIGCAYKWSDGTETGTFTVTTADTSTSDTAFILLSIPNAHQTTIPEAGSYASSTAGTANPASFNPAGWGTEDTLWISVGGSGETSLSGAYTGLATPPANFTNDVQTGISADAVGGVEGGVAFYQLNAASVDAANWTSDTSNARDAAIVIAVRPIVPVLRTITDTGVTQTDSLSRFKGGIVYLSDFGISYDEAVTAYTFPTATGNISRDRTDWATPENITADDSSAATHSSNGGSNILVGKTFGFSLPSGAVIDNFEVEILFDVITAGGNLPDKYVQLTKNGTSVIGSFINIGSGGAGVYTAGLTGWSTTLTKDEVEASTFGVGMFYVGLATNNALNVDYYKSRVYYGTPRASDSLVRFHSPAGAVQRTATDTGVTQTDSLKSFPYRVSIADTGVTQTDTIEERIRRVLTDTGVSYETLLNSDFESGIDNWSSFNSASLTLETATVRTGARSLKVITPGSVGNEGIASDFTAVGSAIVGESVLGKLWVNGQAGATLRLFLRINNAAGTQLTATSKDITLVGGWEYHDVHLVATHADSSRSALRIYTTTTTQATTFYIDDASVGAFDSLLRQPTRPLTDTGVTQTDSLVRLLVAPRTLSDTAVTQTDSLSTLVTYTRSITDTGAAISETLVTRRARLATDTGVTPGESLVRLLRAARPPTDTGVTQTDSLVRRPTRPVTDTGLTNTDSLVKLARLTRAITDTGVAFSDVLGPRIYHNISDTLTFGDSLARILTLPRSITDTGVTNSVTNLITNGGFETNTTGWSNYNAADVSVISRDTSRSRYGVASLKVVVTGGGGGAPGCQTNKSLALSTVYTISGWVLFESGSSLVIEMNGIGVASSSGGISPSSQWQRLSLTFTSSASDPNHQLYFIRNGGTSAMTYYVDGAQLEIGSQANPYVETDGASVSGWTSDSIDTRRAPTISDTLTFTDTLTTLRLRPLTDTGATIVGDSINAVFTPGSTSYPRTATDTGVTQTDSLVTRRAPTISDTGVTPSDSLTKLSILTRAISDTGLTQSDTIFRSMLWYRKFGIAHGDGLGAHSSTLLPRTNRRLTDTGITNTDSFHRTNRRTLRDSGVRIAFIDKAQNLDSLNYWGRTIMNSERIAQSFVPEYTAALTIVNYSIWKNNSPVDNVIVEIWSDSGGLPNASIGSVETVAGSSLSAIAGSSRTVTGLNIPLTQGTKYWIVLRRDGSLNNTNNYAYYHNSFNQSGDVYPNNGRSGYGSGVWDAANPEDMAFTTTQPFESIKKSVSKILTDYGVNPPAAFENLFIRTSPTLSDTLTFSDVLTRRSVPTLTDTAVTNTDSLSRINHRFITDTGVTLSDVLGPRINHYLTDTAVTPSDSLVRTARFSFTATDTGVTPSDSLRTLRLHVLSDTGLTLSDTLVKVSVTFRTVSDTGVTSTDALITLRNRAVSDALTFSDALVRLAVTTRTATDTGVTQTDTFIRFVTHSLSDTLTFSDTLTKAGSVSRTLTDTGTTFSDALIKFASKSLTDTGVTLTDVLAERINHYVSDTGVTNTDSLVRTTTIFRTLSDTGVTQTDTLIDLRNRILTDTLTFSDTLVKRAVITRTVSDTGLTQTDSLATLRHRQLTETLTFSDSISTVSARSFTISDTGVTSTDSLLTRRNHVLSDTGLTSSDTFTRFVARFISDTGVTITDAVVKGRSLSITDTGVTPSDTLVAQRVLSLTLSDTITFSDTLATLRARPLTDTGTTTTDTLLTLRHHVLSDTGVAFSDVLAERINHYLTDTLTFTDSLNRRLVALRTAADTGLAQTDSLSTRRTRPLTDTLTFSDSLVKLTSAVRALTDTLTFSDSLTRLLIAPRTASDTGVTNTDSLLTRRTHSLSDTLSISDTLLSLRNRSLIDTLVFTDSIVKGRSLPITDTGVTNTDSIARLVWLHYDLTDTGTTPSDTLVTRRTHVLTDTGATTSDALLTLRSRRLTDSLSFSDVLAERINHYLTDTLTFSDNLDRRLVVTRTATDTGLTQTDALTTLRTRPLSDTLTISDSLVVLRRYTRTISDTLTFTDNLNTASGNTRNVSDTGVTQSDSLATLRTHALSDSLSFSDVLAERIYHYLTDTITFSDSLTRRLVVTRTVTDTLTQSDTLVTLRNRSLSDTLTFSDSLTAQRAFRRTLTDTLTFTDVLASASGGRISDTGVTQSDALTRYVSHSLSDTLTFSDSLAYLAGKVITLSDTGLSQTDSLLTLRTHSLSDTLTQSDTLTSLRLYTRSLTDTLAFSDVLAERISHYAVDTLTFTDSITKYVTHSITDTGITQTDSLVRSTGGAKVLSDVGVTQTDALLLGTHRRLSDTGLTQIDFLGNALKIRLLVDTGVTQTDFITKIAFHKLYILVGSEPYRRYNATMLSAYTAEEPHRRYVGPKTVFRSYYVREWWRKWKS